MVKITEAKSLYVGTGHDTVIGAGIILGQHILFVLVNHLILAAEGLEEQAGFVFAEGLRRYHLTENINVVGIGSICEQAR